MLGSANMDVGLRVAALPGAGQTVLGGDAVFRPGGKGANQAVAAALTGAAVRFAGCVGEDPDGQELRAALVRNSVDVTLLRSTGGARTGLAVVLVEDSGANAIVVSPGANHAMTVDDVEALRGAIGDAGLLLMQLELPTGVVVRAVDLAWELHTPVILNLAPAAHLPPATLAKLAVLVVNESEAEFLLGERLTALHELHAAATRLRASGPAAVVVTAGAQGAVLDDGSGPVHVPAVAVEVLDTAGAGDAFAGTLAAGVCRGATVAEAAAEAVAAAAIAVGTAGAQLSA